MGEGEFYRTRETPVNGQALAFWNFRCRKMKKATERIPEERIAVRIPSCERNMNTQANESQSPG